MEILAEYVGKDYIHLLVSVPPHLSASKLVQYVKGNTSRKLQMEYKELNKQFWGQHLWARGYFVASSGNVTDEIIQEYGVFQKHPILVDKYVLVNFAQTTPYLRKVAFYG